MDFYHTGIHFFYSSPLCVFKIQFGQIFYSGQSLKAVGDMVDVADIKTPRAFIFVQLGFSSGNCQTIKAGGIKGGKSPLMGFQTRQIRTGKLQHKGDEMR